LIPESYPLPHREEIRAFPKAMGNVTLYLGFKESPAKLGFQGENHWIYQDYDHDRTFAQLTSLEEFPTHDLFARWQDRPWKRRGEEYTEFKERLSQSLIELVESKYPGFRYLIAYSELSTPLTVEFLMLVTEELFTVFLQYQKD
jgi:hypothetical protein